MVPGQIVVADAATVTDGAGAGKTVIVTEPVAVRGLAHKAVEVIITDTTAPLVKVEVVKVGLFDPAFTPFTCHWYDGLLPPFVGVAVNVTDVPGQILLVDALTETDGAGAGNTVIVTGALVTVVGDGQSAFDVINTVTTSPLFNVELVKLLLFVPTLTPFTCH